MTVHTHTSTEKADKQILLDKHHQTLSARVHMHGALFGVLS